MRIATQDRHRKTGCIARDHGTSDLHSEGINDMHGSAKALWHAAALAQYERNPAEVKCYWSDFD
jgi:hypothetical protein